MATDDEREEELQVPCEVYSRIVGYLRPVQDWHAAKQLEFSRRKTFDTVKTLKKEMKEEKDD